MKIRISYGLVFILMLILASCEEDIDITGDFGSKPVAYCLMDPADSVHYLRISKSFIVKSNPYEYEIPPDSLILHEDFYAYLEEEMDGGSGDITYFGQTILSERDSGFFPQEGLVTLSVNRKIKAGENYGLYIHLPGSPGLLSGNTTIIKPVEILDPNPLPGRETTILHGQGYFMRWSSSAKYAVYQPIIRLNYFEGDSIFHSLKTTTLDRPVVFVNEPSQWISSYINGASFFKQIIEKMNKPLAGEKRKFISFDVELYAGGEELALAASMGYGVFQSFTGLNEYSNIDGAIGVFSCISSASANNNRLSDITIDYIAVSDSTRHLGFLKHDQDF